jgi:hypothetical protein
LDLRGVRLTVDPHVHPGDGHRDLCQRINLQRHHRWFAKGTLRLEQAIRPPAHQFRILGMMLHDVLQEPYAAKEW